MEWRRGREEGCDPSPPEVMLLSSPKELLSLKHFSLCALSMLEKRKRWPHTSHGYGFSPVCVRRCRFILGRLVKLFPQISQIYGFSPGKKKTTILIQLYKIFHFVIADVHKTSLLDKLHTLKSCVSA